MKRLVRLRMRPSRDGNRFAYFIDYKDETGEEDVCHWVMPTEVEVGSRNVLSMREL